MFAILKEVCLLSPGLQHSKSNLVFEIRTYYFWNTLFCVANSQMASFERKKNGFIWTDLLMIRR